MMKEVCDFCQKRPVEFRQGNSIAICRICEPIRQRISEYESKTIWDKLNVTQKFLVNCGDIFETLHWSDEKVKIMLGDYGESFIRDIRKIIYENQPRLKNQ